MISGPRLLEIHRPVDHTIAGPLDTPELIASAQAIGRVEMKEDTRAGWTVSITFYSAGGSYVSATGKDRALNAALFKVIDEANAIIAAVGKQP